ncbi:MAG: alpha/beta hydrolase-fold protein [Candidatus Neomarinimicrobiota bacterium]
MFRKMIIAIAVSCFFLFAQEVYLWEIELEVPEETPADARIFIVGNFNNWSPADPDRELSKIAQNLYKIDILTKFEKVEFKFTLGSWAGVEVDENNNNIPNRREKLREKNKKSYKIRKWNEAQDANSIVGNVSVINDFNMPQLGRKRRIWIYLPPSYEKSRRRYPVMYMHDGQNLFSDSTSFSGEWGVDEHLEQMIAEKKIKEIMIVGIENSEYRLSEYSPFDFEYKGLHEAEADKYAQFIVETLKPFIDKEYRTKSGRKHTGIAGSSMGGLVSTYIALEYQEVFSKVGAMSSSFRLCLEDILHYLDLQSKRYSMQFWIDIGSLEGNELEFGISQKPVVDALKKLGWESEKELKYTVYEAAEHHEAYWRARFADVLEYLWGK